MQPMRSDPDEPDLSWSSVRRRVPEGFLERVGRSDEHVVISGAPRREREHVARLVHAASPRRGSAFVVYDPSDARRAADAFGETPLESAGIDRAWSLASGGALFLVELFELSDRDQAFLLRALGTRDAYPTRVSERPRPVRIIAATSHETSPIGALRSSLFHRLNVMNVRLSDLFETPGTSNAGAEDPPLTFKEEKTRLLEAWEPRYLRELLGHVDGNVTDAARIAGIARAHMYRLLKKYGLAR
jgi:DNA-binding NtrC family response regulator